MSECINLKERFGKQYRITFDPAYDHKGVPRKSLDPSMMTIPCHKGIIYPYGGEYLAVEIDYHGPTAKQVGQIPGVVCTQDGDQEKTFKFHVDLFPQIAQLVIPRKKRRLTEEQKQKLVERGRQALEEYQQKQRPEQ